MPSLQRVATRFELPRAEAVELSTITGFAGLLSGQTLFHGKGGPRSRSNITGEFGLSVHQLLGLDTGLGTQDLLSTARMRANYWRTRMIDPGPHAKLSLRQKVLANAYDRLLYQIMAQML